MTYTYREIPPPMSIQQAQDVGHFLAKYEIHVANLTVKHLTRDGKWVTDRPLAATVADAAGSMVLASPVSIPAGIGLAAAGVVISPLALPAVLAAWLGQLKLSYERRKRTPDVEYTESQISFDLADVSALRRKWSEYLLCVYAHAHGWQLSGLQYPDQWNVARGKGYPLPWQDNPRGHSKRKAEKRKPKGKAQPGTVQRFIRDLWG